MIVFKSVQNSFQMLQNLSKLLVFMMVYKKLELIKAKKFFPHLNFSFFFLVHIIRRITIIYGTLSLKLKHMVP